MYMSNMSGFFFVKDKKKLFSLRISYRKWLAGGGGGGIVA